MVTRIANYIRSTIVMTVILLAATACQGTGTEVLGLKNEADARQVMVTIAEAVQTCWFKSKDGAFTDYRLANELNSPAGRPRLLLVPRSRPDDLPLLVIQAENKGSTASGRFADIQTYGPLLSSENGARIREDVTRWAGGNTACT